MMDYKYMDYLANDYIHPLDANNVEHGVPRIFIHLLGPYDAGTSSGANSDIDQGTSYLGFYRNFQCMFGTFMASICICLAYAQIKSKATRLSEDSLANNLLFNAVQTGSDDCNINWVHHLEP